MQHDGVSSITTQQVSYGTDISYNIRHVEEAWHHLIQSKDTQKLKEIAVCNFDFLLAAVSLFKHNRKKILLAQVIRPFLPFRLRLIWCPNHGQTDVIAVSTSSLPSQPRPLIISTLAKRSDKLLFFSLSHSIWPPTTNLQSSFFFASKFYFRLRSSVTPLETSFFSFSFALCVFGFSFMAC